MAARHRYRKKVTSFVAAVRLALDTDGFTYRKWGGVQRCKAGDWIVDNEGDIYTVDAEVFTRTYRAVSPGRYVKVTPVWAVIAEVEGTIQTKEGVSHYAPGDYLVYNDEAGTDSYCMSAEKFEAMYEPDV
jgi:hypothetical protein